ncbi:LacI family DNA-binding transcriptional regulator [Pelagicoccus sp. SDUM812005]|uniref:LacI family DNA-binding transcriptional regulator n=1 Tax=Pelagicoccus sp. SDUM812005 TaxID=3041257 RepID=UPI00280F05E7|nr:LacI family DNA-binding transcriptional regulator [Pelagicoccus sp. SDUM812005]MDQ8179192.1 LacI family DNA-binding transcriptional regulator [Pelagicoccus sp. SDUM812005]
MNSKNSKATLGKRRVTIRDIAEEVGLHFTTVARALKDSDLVKRETAQRVKAAAERLGYQADPFVSAFCSYRSSHLKQGYRGNLSWINGFHSPDYFESEATGYYKECYEGAKERCRELGFKLVPFWYGEPGMSAKRASQIIHSRGEAGLIVAPMPPSIDKLDMRWDSFCSVRIGYSIPDVPLTNVVSDHFGNMKLLCSQLESLGFSRIGFACKEWIDKRVEHKWSGAFQLRRYSAERERYLPMFLSENEDDFHAFESWIRLNRPEVLIIGGVTSYPEFLERMRMRVPEDIQLVSVSLEHDHAGFYAGIDQEAKVVGAVAVDQLAGIVRRSHVGLESAPKTIMTSGFWRGGRSCDPALLAK